MNKQEILTAINKTIKGQGSAVDVGGKLAVILESIIDLIPAPAEQVNSDWNATEGVAEILNKPTIPEGPLVVPITIDSGHTVTLRDGAPTMEEILNALRIGRQVIGLEYSGSDVASHMLCTAHDLGGVQPIVCFFAVDGATIENYGTL